VTFVKRWDRGIPSYAPGHVARVDAIFARSDAIPGLYLN
jgi:protoporphyrinogen oxidase